MANCSLIITNALSRLGVVGANRSVSAESQKLALETLGAVLRRLIYAGTLGTRRTVIPEGEYTAGENEHVFRNTLATDIIINLPETVSDHGSFHLYYGLLVRSGSQRTPKDGAFVIITDKYSGKTDEYIYDGATKTWLNIGNLTVVSPCPFAHRDSVGMAAMLATELADYFGAEVPQATLLLRNQFMRSLTANHTESDASQPNRIDYF